MEFKGLTSASHMSLPEAGYGSEEGYVGSEISGAVSGVTTPGASRLQASQLQQRSTTMQRLQQLHDVLLLARKRFHLDLIQVYLKGRQSIFKNVTGQLVVFSTIVSLGCVAQPRFFSS